MKNNNLSRLVHPLFLASVLLLLINDFYLKQTYGNVLTGKISDFAGLFAFPFFFSCLFVKHKKIIHIVTIFLFIWWKSTFSQPIIDFVNNLGIPVNRVVDFSDNIALISVLISYIAFSGAKIYSVKPVMKWTIMSVSLLSFIATSLPPKTALEYCSVDKEYVFAMPIGEFISRFNRIQKKEIDKASRYWGYYDEASQIFYSSDGKDTITYLIDIAKHTNTDTIRFNNYFASFQIYNRNNDSTVLKLIDITILVTSPKLERVDSSSVISVSPDFSTRFKYSYPVWSYVKNPNNEKLKQKAIKQFEKKLIKKIK